MGLQDRGYVTTHKYIHTCIHTYIHTCIQRPVRLCTAPYVWVWALVYHLSFFIRPRNSELCAWSPGALRHRQTIILYSPSEMPEGQYNFTCAQNRSDVLRNAYSFIIYILIVIKVSWEARQALWLWTEGGTKFIPRLLGLYLYRIFGTVVRINVVE